MIIHNCEQMSDEWFALRLGKITASHFSDVLNKKTGRKTYMLKLLAERLSGEAQVSYSNGPMERGVEVEHLAREHYEALWGIVEQIGFVELSDDVGCSPDGFVGYDGIIEIKCPNSSTHLSYIDKNVFPASYKPQVQGNLWVTGRQWCDFISFDPRIKAKPFWKIRIKRDRLYIDDLSDAVKKFIKEMRELEDKIINKMNF